MSIKIGLQSGTSADSLLAWNRYGIKYRSPLSLAIVNQSTRILPRIPGGTYGINCSKGIRMTSYESWYYFQCYKMVAKTISHVPWFTIFAILSKIITFITRSKFFFQIMNKFDLMRWLQYSMWYTHTNRWWKWNWFFICFHFFSFLYRYQIKQYEFWNKDFIIYQWHKLVNYYARVDSDQYQKLDLKGHIE